MEENIEEVTAESGTETAAESAAAPSAPPRHRRQEKVGLVTSDKMQKTVVVRVERQVRHRKYKRYNSWLTMRLARISATSYE